MIAKLTKIDKTFDFKLNSWISWVWISTSSSILGMDCSKNPHTICRIYIFM